jgi:hypothetical protein
MAKSDHDYLFKIFLIGDSAVVSIQFFNFNNQSVSIILIKGKTSILRKFAVPDEVVETTYISTVGM